MDGEPWIETLLGSLNDFHLDKVVFINYLNV